MGFAVAKRSLLWRTLKNAKILGLVYYGKPERCKKILKFVRHGKGMLRHGEPEWLHIGRDLFTVANGFLATMNQKDCCNIMYFPNSRKNPILCFPTVHTHFSLTHIHIVVLFIIKLLIFHFMLIHLLKLDSIQFKNLFDCLLDS